jgi:hypothetical protein
MSKVLGAGRSTTFLATLALTVPALAGLPAAAASPAGPRAVVPHVLAKPRVPSGVYLGVVPNFDTSEGTGAQAATFTADTSRPPAIVSFYINWSSPLPTDLDTVSNAGSLPMVSWKCGPSDASVAAGQDDSTITAAAEAYKAFGKPILLRWFWEMNWPNIVGHETCLGSTLSLADQAADFIAAWKHIWQIFQTVGATNVAFVWAPSAALHAPDACATATAPTCFYPGNQYVDWIGSDVYDRTGYNNDFAYVYKQFYSKYENATYGNKPIILSETGADGSTDQVPWLSGLGSSLRTEFPALHAVVYVDGYDIDDYILTPGTPGMAEYRAIASQAYFGAYEAPVDTYGFATSAGSVRLFDGYSYGDCTTSSLCPKPLPAKIVGFAIGPNASGYWLTASDGTVYAFGGVSNLGDMHGKPLNEPIVAMAATPDARGYWLVASDGGMFAFGDARFHGSMGGQHLNKPIVGMASTGDGQGYWLVASDGGMFAFGDAKFRGSMGGSHLNKPIDGMSATADGHGYWLVASDGGIFAFGDAHFGGSLGGTVVSSPIVSAARDLINGFYVVLTAGGTVYQFPGGTIASTSTATSPAVQISTSPIY